MGRLRSSLRSDRGPGPLVGPVLAAQFGYLPGLLWVLAGAVFAGCVQDFVILLFSIRRDGKSLTEMAKEETGVLGGFVAYAAVIAILIILLAVVALVVVNALKDSPWGTFTIAMTIPIALLMGLYLRRIRPGKSARGFRPRLHSGFAGDLGRAVGLAEPDDVTGVHPQCACAGDSCDRLRLRRLRDARVAASCSPGLPQHIRQAGDDQPAGNRNRGVASHFAYAGAHTICGRLWPGFRREIFPFAFITIACGAVSGFHSLISSGTTPKLIARETEARMVGYGAMAAESAAGGHGDHRGLRSSTRSVLRGKQSGGNCGSDGFGGNTTTISNWGFTVTTADMQALAQAVGEKTLFNRTGGAPAFALGTAHIFSQSLGGYRSWRCGITLQSCSRPRSS